MGTVYYSISILQTIRTVLLNEILIGLIMLNHFIAYGCRLNFDELFSTAFNKNLISGKKLRKIHIQVLYSWYNYNTSHENRNGLSIKSLLLDTFRV